MKYPHTYRSFLEMISVYNNDELLERILWDNEASRLGERFMDPAMPLMPAVYIIDYTQRQYAHTNNQMSRITGYNNQYMLDGGLDFSLGLWNRADLKIFSENVLADNLKFLQSVPPETHPDYVFSCNYRIKAKNGDVRNLLQRSIFIRSTDKGMPLMAIGFLTDITHFTNRFQVFHTIEKHDSFTGEPVLKKWYFPDHQGGRLTPRQAEIVKWLCEGLTSEKIAARLHLSVNTVNNHRRQILRNTNCTNSVELMRYAFENNYL